MNKKIRNLDFGKIFTSHAFLLCFLMLIMLFLRIVPFYHTVFTSWPGTYGNFVNFASDDAVYHMRIVHNTLGHFPWRVFFDPFTYFPYGSQVHFGPFFTFIIAGSAWVLGFGHPSVELVNIVGAYLPPILGALCLIPTYFIAKKLFGKNAAFLAALVLTFLPGAFFQRSTLGFADHHVAETLFSSLSFMFVFYAFDARETERGSGKFWLYSLLAGFFFGIYLLSWPAALMFAGILFIFLLVMFISDTWRRRSTNYLLVLATGFYLPAMLMVLPYALMNPRLQLGYYSWTQPLVLLLLFAAILFCFLLANLSKTRRWHYILFSLLTSASVFGLTRWLFPEFARIISGGIQMLFTPKLGMYTVSEVWPAIIDPVTESFTLHTLWLSLFWALPCSLVAIPMFCDKALREGLPKDFLLAIWSILILFATAAQQRFAYYFAINAALLAAYVFNILFNCISEGSALGFIKNSKMRPCSQFILLGVLALAIIYPIFRQDVFSCAPRITKEWYEALIWLKTNTPDPQGSKIQKDFNYKNGFYPIPRQLGNKYSYPSSAYGVVIWWDHGHQLTYIAERIPNANPFQEGIIEEKNPNIGVAPFFTALDESTAVQNLDAMGSRYIVVDNDTVSRQYYAMRIWETNRTGDLGEENRTVQGDKSVLEALTKLHRSKGLELPMDKDVVRNSMLDRLYYQDGNSFSHLRLVYESTGDYVLNAKYLDPKTGQINHNYRLTNGNYAYLAEISKRAQKLTWLDEKQKNALIYDAKEPVHWIKIFEKVPGAKITGSAPENTEVSLSLVLLTNSGRVFIYKQKNKARSGQYEFTVPYATEVMRGVGYAYDVVPLTRYSVKIGTTEELVAVREEQVMHGETVANIIASEKAL